MMTEPAKVKWKIIADIIYIISANYKFVHFGTIFNAFCNDMIIFYTSFLNLILLDPDIYRFTPKSAEFFYKHHGD